MLETVPAVARLTCSISIPSCLAHAAYLVLPAGKFFYFTFFHTMVCAMTYIQTYFVLLHRHSYIVHTGKVLRLVQLALYYHFAKLTTVPIIAVSSAVCILPFTALYSLRCLWSIRM
jgi:hypothetical protein